MKLKTGDKVVVIAGKDKGKEGLITKTLSKDNKVIVEGVNIVKKNNKPKTKKPTRIGHSTDKKGKKIRIAKKSNESID